MYVYYAFLGITFRFKKAPQSSSVQGLMYEHDTFKFKEGPVKV